MALQDSRCVLGIVPFAYHPEAPRTHPLFRTEPRWREQEGSTTRPLVTLSAYSIPLHKLGENQQISSECRIREVIPQMLPAIIISLLAGMVLGQRFKVMILALAISITVLLAIGAPIARAGSAW